MRYDEVLINYALYVNSVEKLGTVDVTMPTINHKRVSATGAGIAGEVEFPVVGHVEPMTCQITFRNHTASNTSLMAPGIRDIELRGAREEHDTETGVVEIIPIKYVMRVEALEHNLGKIAPQSTGDGTGSFSVKKLMGFENGKKFMDIDPLNYKYEVDGVDYLAAARSALGK